VPGDKNSLVRVHTPRELRGTIKAGKGGNKTHVVVLHLIRQLQKPLLSFIYYIFLDNLFVFTKFVKYAYM
jgi:hypothetical protein